MRNVTRSILTGISSFALALALGGSSARGQGTGSSGSLGGYGAMAGGSGTLMSGGSNVAGMGGSTVIPFGGRFGAGMPSGMGGGGGLSFQPRPSSTMSGTRTSFTIGPMGGGMSEVMGQGSGRRPLVLPNLGSSGVSGLGGGMRRQIPTARGMGVMPPNFGYPFRQPPSLLTPSFSSAGMSM
jgi:hypothetical protein